MPDPHATTTADGAIDALMALLAERPWAEISVTDIAERAGIGLGALRAAFPSKGAILGGFNRRIDQAVLSAETADEAYGEPPRERLFDLMMRRFDALAPYREAIRAVRDGMRRDALFALAWNRVAVTSAQWMLAAAGIPETGALAAARAQAFALLSARVLEVWLDDADPGLARTMAALDRALRRAEQMARASDTAARLGRPLLHAATRRPHLRRPHFGRPHFGRGDRDAEPAAEPPG